MVADEAMLVTDRLNRQLASEAVLLQLAVSSVISADAGTLFRTTVEQLTEG